jgi:predicted metal-dependent hydrolase
MKETIQLGDISVLVTRKAVKNVHLSVHPPFGRVTLVAPTATRLDVARAYASSRLAWIRQQQASFQAQAREAPRSFVERETHQLWGRHHLLRLVEKEAKPTVALDHRRITLSVRPGTDLLKRSELLHQWHLRLLHEAIPPMIDSWSHRLKVNVAGYFLQRMKTKWGSCNHRIGHIRLNTELVMKPKDLLEYVVVHEMVHLIEPTHSERFVTVLTENYPSWREARAELNGLPLSAEFWNE